MYLSDFFYGLPLAVIYGFSVLLVLGALSVGLYLGRRHLRGHGEIRESSTGTAVAATLGLLAFLLAFTFNMSANRFQERRTLLLNEANTIYTAYLRADFLGPAEARRARALLAEYVDLRDRDPRTTEVTPQLLARMEAIHGALWQLVEGALAGNYDARLLRQFVEPLNQVINFHHSRVVVGLEYRIPGPIWVALYFMTAMAMLAVGFQFGISRGGSVPVALALALTFATAIVLIADLDRPTQGVLLVDQRPLAELNQLLQKKLGSE